MRIFYVSFTICQIGLLIIGVFVVDDVLVRREC